MKRSSRTALRAIDIAKRATDDALALATLILEELALLRAEIVRRKGNNQ